MIEKLKRYRVICWDMDETVISNIDSERFIDFITRNPYGQEHHLITFRSHGLVQWIDDDLAQYGTNRSIFNSVHTCPDKTYTDYYYGNKAGLITNLDDCEYLHWKGQVAHSIGGEVLIDDMTEMVQRGCLRYGIDLIHPDDLFDD